MRSLMLSLAAVALAAQTYPPAFPRTNATKLLETEQFTVWDIVWPKGEPTPLHRHVYDQVGTYYQPGGRVITSLDGTRRETTTEVGRLSNTRRGTTHVEEGTTDPPLRAVFIELKQDGPSGGAESPGGTRSPFPRTGATQLLDDERVTVWDYTWPARTASPLTQHGRESIWIWLAEGTLAVTDGAGARTELAVEPGDIRRVARGQVESDEAVAGRPRAMIVSFK